MKKFEYKVITIPTTVILINANIKVSSNANESVLTFASKIVIPFIIIDST